MQRAVRCQLAAIVAIATFATAAAAQAPPAVDSISSTTTASAPTSDAPPAQAGAERGGGAKGFLGDVGRDYKNFISIDTAKWLAAGGTAAVAMHAADQMLHDSDDAINALSSMTGGQQYGNLSLQVPLAVGWWIAGAAAGSAREADTGRDLVRAQISALSWTYAFKYTVNRTRPNGDPRSFPSGHASATFTTAMVLQQHYGWKFGVPAFAAAVYTASSRIVDDKHWASDVVFGAVLGMTTARTVTVHVRETRLAIAPAPVPGGVGVLVSASRYGS